MSEDKPDLKTVDFTITEVPGRFITTPEVATHIGIDIDNGPAVYVCTECQRTIGERTLMYLDLQEAQKGWRHLKPCNMVDQQIVGSAPGDIRLLAKKRVAAAYTIAKTLLPNANAEEVLAAAAHKLQTTQGIQPLREELLLLRDRKPLWWKGDEASWKKFNEEL